MLVPYSRVPSVKKDENTMYNVSAEGTFEKREIRKFVTTETYDDN
jgi:hypothetical protein